jgi:AsmA protein
VLKVNPLKLDLYEGRARGAATLDVTRDTPRLRSKLDVSGVQAEPLLRDLTGQALMTGKGNVRADITAKGDSADAIKRTLNGTTGLVFKNGAVNGINVAKIIREASARLKGKSIPEVTEANKTDFTELSATATITNGVVNNDDLKLKSPLIRIAGRGSASLPAETLDYTVDATVVGSLKGEGGRSAEELKGLTVPVKIAGSFSDPQIGPDMEALAKEGARQLSDKHKDKATKKARKSLEKKLGKDAGGQLGDQLDGALDSLLK